RRHFKSGGDVGEFSSRPAATCCPALDLDLKPVAKIRGEPGAEPDEGCRFLQDFGQHFHRLWGHKSPVPGVSILPLVRQRYHPAEHPPHASALRVPWLLLASPGGSQI